ncbi:MAG: AI-2E family transporter [Planctomycetota bacterium]|nr:MAG: AI-2E family transporter [Planctomycetota bacterium]
MLTGIVATVLVGWVLIQGAHILQPLVIAMLLCSVLTPVVRILARFGIPSWATVVLLLLALVAGVERSATPLFVEVRAFWQGGGFEQTRDALIARAQDDWNVPSGWTDALRTWKPDQELLGLAPTANAFLRGLFLVTIYMIFIFAEAQVFRRKILAVAEKRARDTEAVINSITFGIQRYLGVKTVTSLATGVLCFTVLQILGLPYALLFGFLTFLLNFIPTFGSFAAAVPPIATALVTRDGLTDAIIVGITYFAVNITIGGILEPRLLGRELNLSPLVVLVSVVVWAALWGVPGMFLAVPLTATAQIVMNNMDSTRSVAILLSNGPPAPRRRRKRRGGDDDDEDDDDSESDDESLIVA